MLRLIRPCLMNLHLHQLPGHDFNCRLSLGRNLLLETDASGAPLTGDPGTQGIGFLAQGFLESSNVQVVEEIINMIIAQRAYEASSKVIQTSDEMLQLANNIGR